MNFSVQNGLTLRDSFQKFRVSDHVTVLHLWHVIMFLGLAPQVGPTVHAGYVKDRYPLQRHAAQIQRFPTALRGANKQVF